MPLPLGFEFSQGSLQDYVDCPRRFQLKYIEEQPWPAVEAEPVLEREQHSIRGRRFHRLMERYYLGVPSEVLESSIKGDVQLLRWWQAFQEEPPLSLPESVLLPEVRLATSVGGRRLVAVVDLLAVEPGRRLVIVDWKTGRYRPARDQMAGRLQTLVYPFVVVEAGDVFFGGTVDPARVMMVYWFADYPEQPHVFHYDAVQHEQARERLVALVDEVCSVDRGAGAWPRVEDDRLCRYCVYRSLCDRGVEAGLGDGLALVDEGDVGVGRFSLDDVFEVGY